MSNPLLRCLCIGFSLAAWACGISDAAAQSYPTRSIRLVVAAPPGGGTDFIARLLAKDLTTALGQGVYVDNRGGAGGNIAADIVAKAPADGYTLLMVAASHAINPSLYRKLSYDPIKDFVAITEVATSPYVLVINSSIPAKTLAEFAAYAQSKKGALNYASAGVGQASHLGMEMLKSMMHFDAVHVPYEGGTSSVADVETGRIDASLWSAPNAITQVKTGKVRALAVTGLKRLDNMPDVPTVAESGYPGFEVTEWKGFLAPTGTPKEVVTRIYQETAKILATDEVKKQMAAVGQDAVSTTPKEFDAYIKAEMAKYAKAVKQAGVVIN